MCIILSVYQKEKERNIQKTIIQLYEEQKLVHKHGVSIVAYDKKRGGEIYRHRELYVSVQEIKEILEAFDVVHIQLRQATSGSITKDNCHFWSINGWSFAHNGMVYGKETNSLANKKTDSLLLFEDLIQKKFVLKKGILKFDAIREHISNIGFWGRFTLLNEQSKKMYYFGDFHAYTLGNNTLIVSTASLEFASVFSLFGLLFEDNSVPVRDMDFEGIYLVDAIKHTAREIYEGDIERNFKAFSYGKKQEKTGNTLFMGAEYAGKTSAEQEEINENIQRQMEKSVEENPNRVDEALTRAEKKRLKKEIKARSKGDFYTPKDFTSKHYRG